mgnify:CR=1 FL=1
MKDNNNMTDPYYKKRIIFAILITIVVIILTNKIWLICSPIHVGLDIKGGINSKVKVLLNKKNDDNFEKTVDMLETYFKNGGIHFQLTYVSKEALIKAKETPENYGNLRVRVTGFSDYFVKLNESLQDDIIERTTHKC